MPTILCKNFNFLLGWEITRSTLFCSPQYMELLQIMFCYLCYTRGYFFNALEQNLCPSACDCRKIHRTQFLLLNHCSFYILGFFQYESEHSMERKSLTVEFSTAHSVIRSPGELGLLQIFCSILTKSRRVYLHNYHYRNFHL